MLEHTLYVVRHGENPANINREFSYRLVDYSLTPRGLEQAQQTADFFRDQRIDALYSSPLKRAHETAAVIGAALDLPIMTVEALREINVGSLEEQAPTDENWALHDQIIADWREGRHHVTFPGGEDFLTLLARLRVGLGTILADTQDATSPRALVAVAHGGTLSGLIRGLCTAREIAMLGERPCLNCSITEFGAWCEDGQPRLTLRAYARVDHLKE